MFFEGTSLRLVTGFGLDLGLCIGSDHNQTSWLDGIKRRNLGRFHEGSDAIAGLQASVYTSLMLCYGRTNAWNQSFDWSFRYLID